MKIKNIQEYRSFYKTKVRKSSERNENFIGNFMLDPKTREKTFGWFEMYHGDKEGYGKAEAGIENFLQSFLDMAKDGQAVYEFLQNAVDASSTHYAMVWGKDEVDGKYYLLVANNGKMFNLDSIRSILNVGASTKSNDSQTIGKFGIGFKLAHRLVGKDNGLDELINEYSGPILFSWKNYEIEQLAAGEPVEPAGFNYNIKSDGNFEATDDYPWLFKILITCFPCLPENSQVAELPILVNGQAATVNPFSNADYQVLSRWIKKHQHILNKETYNEGALFFIKLGTGKEEELEEVNLKEGVKFAIAILKETATAADKEKKLLHTVQLNNNETITYPKLEYVKLTISKETDKDQCAYIRFGVDTFEELTEEQKKKIIAEADIEALFGFKKYDDIGNFFKGAPNLYLYFPLSEEVHNFNYILHSNAFYKGSSRTFLHKGNSRADGINERLLKVIVIKVEETLKQLSASDNSSRRALYLHFYASLLSSGRSANQDRLWIETPFIDPMDNCLKSYIPVRRSGEKESFAIATDARTVFIKQTAVDIDTVEWGLKNVNWFFWDLSDVDIITKAIEKLGVKRYTIFDLLEISGIEGRINEWMNGEENKIRIVLRELTSTTPDKSIVDKVKPQLLQLKLFKFSNGDLLSLDEFLKKETEGYFLLHNTLGEVREHLQKVGLVTTMLDLDEYKFVEIYRSFVLQGSKHSGYTELTRLFSTAVKDESLSRITRAEKMEIFSAFRNFNDENRVERMRELKLFVNNAGKAVAFKYLLAPMTGSWMNRFSISSTEYDEQLKSFFLSERRDFYQYLVYPFWEDILSYVLMNKTKLEEIANDLATLFEESNWPEKIQHMLSNKLCIIYRNEVIVSNNTFYKKNLSALSPEDFSSVQEMALKYYKRHIPDQFIIKNLDRQPFSFATGNLDVALDTAQPSLNDINSLMLLNTTCGADFFTKNVISLKDGVYVIDNNSIHKQCYTGKPAIADYVAKYCKDELVLLPNGINADVAEIPLSGTALANHLIDTFVEEETEQELDLIAIVLNESQEQKVALLSGLTSVRFDAGWEEVRKNELYLKLLDAVVDTTTAQELQTIHNQIVIYNNEEICIGEIGSANDTITIMRGTGTINLSQSKILNLDSAEKIKIINDFHSEAQRRNLINPSNANRLFKISPSIVSDDLTTRFLGNLDNKQIENSDQLIFLLLSGKLMNQAIGEFKLLSQEGKWRPVKGPHIIYTEENNKFIAPDYLLHSRYHDLQTLLDLGNLEVLSYGDAEENIFTARFLFVKGLHPNILKSTYSVREKLDYLFDGWKHLSRQVRVTKRKDNWREFLGICPNEFVADGILTLSEMLPTEFMDWYAGERARQDLLQALGVFVEDMHLVPLRRFLLKEISGLPENCEWRELNHTVLLNTLRGLTGEFVSLNSQPIIFSLYEDIARIQLVEQMMAAVMKQNSDCPLLVYENSMLLRLENPSQATFYYIDPNIHAELNHYNNTSHLNQLYQEYRIVKLLDFEMSPPPGIVKLELDHRFVPSEIPDEHDEPFYHSWSAENNISLIREEKLNFDIYEATGDLYLGRIAKNNFFIDDREDVKIRLYYAKGIHLEGLHISLLQTDATMADQVMVLITRRDVMLRNIYNAYNAANKEDVSSDQLLALQAAFREENLKEERRVMVDRIKENVKYSHVWFKSYLEYLLTFSKNSEDSQVQKTIRFQGIKKQVIEGVISQKYFLLSAASSYISDAIEDICDFTLTVTTRSQKVYKPDIEGAQKQGQNLLVYCPRGIGGDLFSHLEDVLLAEITFTPKIDLLNELKNALSDERNVGTWEDVSTELPPVHFIYGPPGTGKTTSLCKEIIAIKKRQSNARMLYLTPTNKAADVLFKKLLLSHGNKEDVINKQLTELKANDAYLSVYRIGKATDPEIEKYDPEVYQDSVDNNLLQFVNVLGMTIHRLPYTKVMDDSLENEIRLFRLPDYWDYIIFDEASMINLPYLVFAIMSVAKFSPKVKIIIAGDPKQIPPVADLNDKELEELEIHNENIYSMMNIHSFNEKNQQLREIDTIQNLNIQYRSVPEIGQLFSELSYDRLLKHGREVGDVSVRKLPAQFAPIFKNNVSFVDIPLSYDESIFKIRKLLGGSSYHIYSAILVSEIVKFLDKTLPENENWSVGLIAPYKAQAVMMNKLIESSGISDRVKVYADTVHGFQGDECDIVFFVSNPNNYTFTSHAKSLLSKEYVYNVAISRARDYLVILHPFSGINNNPFINSIKNTYAENFGAPLVKMSGDIEAVIFGQDSFVYSNSYITGHDIVNVFGQIEKKYFIKANSTTVDIQLRK